MPFRETKIFTSFLILTTSQNNIFGTSFPCGFIMIMPKEREDVLNACVNVDVFLYEYEQMNLNDAWNVNSFA